MDSQTQTQAGTDTETDLALERQYQNAVDEYEGTSLPGTRAGPLAVGGMGPGVTHKARAEARVERGRILQAARDAAIAEGDEDPDGPMVVDGYVLADGCYTPWEQLEGEGTKAYAAFTLYRDAGYTRSLHGVSRQLQKHVALIHKWSTLHRWVDRVRRYELYLDRQKRGQIEEARLGMLERHRSTAERVVSLVDRWVDAKLLQDADKIPDNQIAALLRVASVVERQSLGLPAESSATYNEHRHTLEVEVGPAAGDSQKSSAVQDWVSKLRDRAATLGLELPADSTPLDGDVLEADVRELGIDPPASQ
jgi:hypothetical protein